MVKIGDVLEHCYICEKKVNDPYMWSIITGSCNACKNRLKNDPRYVASGMKFREYLLSAGKSLKKRDVNKISDEHTIQKILEQIVQLEELIKRFEDIVSKLP